MSAVPTLIIEGDVDHQGVAAIERMLAAGTLRSARYLAQTGSTNTLALADLAAPHSDSAVPRLYLADQQTAGRGRHGRQWISSLGTLTFSLVIDCCVATHPAARLLSVAVGLGIGRALEFEFAPLRTRLKWPNDVHLGGGKVAGVLLETTQSRPDRVVIGIGINVDGKPDLSADATASPAQSLSEASGRTVSRYQLLEPLCGEVLQAIAQLPQDADELVDEFRQRCLLSGQAIRFQKLGVTIEAICRGISPNGELMVETAAGIEQLHSGDVQLLRIR